jgi:hypothetical protein
MASNYFDMRLHNWVWVLFLSSVCILYLTISVNAQASVTMPTTPKFGVSYRITSVYIQPIYGFDTSTGQSVITQAGYYTNNEDVWIEILNQPFNPYNDSEGNYIQLFYNLAWREPINNSWVTLESYQMPTQNQDGDRTLAHFEYRGNYNSGPYAIDIPIGNETDFQVQALIGYFTSEYVFVGKTSDWANAQSVQHANYSSLVSPSPSPSSGSIDPSVLPSQNFMKLLNSSSIWVGYLLAILLLVIFSVIMFFYFRRRHFSQKSN